MQLYPYEACLIGLVGETVTVDRRDASSATGRVSEVKEEGFYLTTKEGVVPGMLKYTYIAFLDVRGVTREVHDLEE